MQEPINFTVPAEGAHIRLDVYVSERQPDLTRSRVQTLIEEGCLFVNEKIVKAGYKLREGDTIRLTIPPMKELSTEAENLPLDIVYEDEDIAIVNKPRGMVVHPAAGHESGTLVNALQYHFKGRLSGINGVLRPGIVHRIDKDTSGLLIICKTDRAHQIMGERLHRHDINRVYHAIVHGHFREKEGVIDAPIGRMTADRKKMGIRPDGRRAVSHYRVLQEWKDFSYVEVKLETGRTHQIRVHMKSIGHPVLGDPVYGPQKATTALERKLQKESFWPGQILHAKVLGFMHPISGEYVEWNSELPEYFQSVLHMLEKQNEN